MSAKKIDYARRTELRKERAALLEAYKRHELKSKDVAHRLTEIDAELMEVERGKKRS